MKKIIAILLLISFTIQVTGYHIYFGMRRWEARIAMKRNLQRHLEQEGVKEFVFCESDHCSGHQPHWERSDEFDLDGQLYDVIEKERKGDSLYVRCISDEKESELLKRYLALSKDDFSGKSKKRSVSLLKMLNSFVSYYSSQESSYTFYSKSDEAGLYYFHLLSIPHEVIKPPPRC